MDEFKINNRFAVMDESFSVIRPGLSIYVISAVTFDGIPGNIDEDFRKNFSSKRPIKTKDLMSKSNSPKITSLIAWNSQNAIGNLAFYSFCKSRQVEGTRGRILQEIFQQLANYQTFKFIMDSRISPHLPAPETANKRDLRIMTDLKAKNLLSQRTSLKFLTDDDFHLLGNADFVAWVSRTNLITGDRSWVERLKIVQHEIPS
jgi:hypothetical protein